MLRGGSFAALHALQHTPRECNDLLRSLSASNVITIVIGTLVIFIFARRFLSVARFFGYKVLTVVPLICMHTRRYVHTQAHAIEITNS